MPQHTRPHECLDATTLPFFHQTCSSFTGASPYSALLSICQPATPKTCRKNNARRWLLRPTLPLPWTFSAAWRNGVAGVSYGWTAVRPLVCVNPWWIVLTGLRRIPFFCSFCRRGRAVSGSICECWLVNAISTAVGLFSWIFSVLLFLNSCCVVEAPF